MPSSISVFPLYGGEVQLRVYPDDWPDRSLAHSYHDEIGRLPGVTTISGSVATGGKLNALMKWAAETDIQKYRELLLTEMEDEARVALALKEHNAKRDAAGDIGTAVHSWVEAHIRARTEFGEEPVWPSDSQVQSGCTAYLAWERDQDVKYDIVEQPVMSRLHRFAGRLDIGLVGGRRCLLDIKTSNGMREEYVYQTAAYICAREEEYPDSPFEDRIILMLSKENGKFTPIQLGVQEVRKDYAAFLGAKAVYERSVELRPLMDELYERKKRKRKEAA